MTACGELQRNDVLCSLTVNPQQSPEMRDKTKDNTLGSPVFRARFLPLVS